MSEVVGLLGVGRMGAGIAATLARAGREVVAFDVRAQRLAAAPVRAAGDAVELARAADVLLSSLPGTPELVEAMTPLIGALRPGASWVDTTSAAPARVAPLARAAAARGVACLDAPLGGGPAQAAEGALRIYVGGDAAALERVRPLLETLGSVVHMGAAGAGYTTKLLANLLWFGQALASGEALLLGARAGIDVEGLRAALTASAGGSQFLARDAPRLLDGDYLEDFGLDRCCEELDAVVALAREMGLPFELSAEVARGYARALERFGPRDGELLGVALLEERAGMLLRRD